MINDQPKQQVQRLTVLGDIFREENGKYVLYTDYAALEKQNAQLRELVRAKDDGLLQLKSDCQSTIDQYHKNGPTWTSRESGSEYYDASYVLDSAQEEIDLIDKTLALTPDNFPTEKKGGDDTDKAHASCGRNKSSDMSGIPSDPASRSTPVRREGCHSLRCGWHKNCIVDEAGRPVSHDMHSCNEPTCEFSIRALSVKQWDQISQEKKGGAA